MSDALNAPAAPAPAPVAAPAAAPVAAPEGFAPAVPAAPEPASAPAPTAEPAAVTYEATGNPGLDLALDFVGARGFGPDHPAIVAAGNGDWAQLEKALAELGDKAKGWEKVLAVGRADYTKVAEARKAESDKVLGQIDKIAEGNWDKVQEYARTIADDGEKANINEAIKLGGIAAVAVAQYLTGLWKQSDSYVKAGTPAVAATAAAASPSSDALSPAAYSEAVRALARQGKVVQGNPEYAALQARRAAYRG
jgi:hypothetical protein